MALCSHTPSLSVGGGVPNEWLFIKGKNLYSNMGV